jgi:hypothetical protein
VDSLNGEPIPTKGKPTGLIVCMPTRGTVSIETMLCINEHLRDVPHELFTTYRLPVVTARNLLAKRAREANPVAFEPRYLLWLDDDIWFTRQHVDTLVTILEENAGVDMATGLCSNRCAYGDSNALTPEDYRRSVAPIALQPGQLAPVGYCGFGFVLMRRALLDRVGDQPFDRLTIKWFWENPLRDIPGRMAEDFSFCRRVAQCGGKIVTEKSLVVGHVDVEDGLIYFPYQLPKIANGSKKPLDLPKDYRGYRLQQRPHDYDMKHAKTLLRRP